MGIPARLNNKDGFNKLQKILTINAKFDKFEQLYELGDEVEIVCVDTANAGNSYLHCWIREFRKMFPNIKIIMGNTVSPRTLKLLDDIGINAVRVGIGSGSMCSTSIQTGIGIGQVSAISECVKFKKRNGLKIQIIADGGIRTTGDICKAMALGADVVMVGRMFAGTEESPGEVIKHNEKKYKVYRGSASYAVKIDKKFIEGEETLVEYKGSVEKILWEIKDGLRSCMSYLGVDSIEELRNEEVLFSILSINSYLERLPYFENK
jgi:IMP dehydrogenase